MVSVFLCFLLHLIEFYSRIAMAANAVLTNTKSCLVFYLLYLHKALHLHRQSVS